MSIQYNFPKKLLNTQLIPNEIIMDKYIALAPINYDNELETEESTKTPSYTKLNSTLYLVSCISDTSNDHYFKYC